MEDKMLEIVENSFKEKIENGDFKKIVDKKLEEMMNDVVNDLVRWNGPVKEYFKKEIEGIMMGVVKDTDFTEYCNVIKGIINQALPHTALPEYKTFVEGLQDTLGKPSPSYSKPVKLSEIFDEYVKFIEGETFNHDDLNYDCDGSYISLNCDFEEERKSTWGSPTCYIHFYINDDDFQGNKDDYDFKVEAFDVNGDTHIRFEKQKVADYRYLRSFELYLLQLANNWVKIEVDDENFEDSASIDSNHIEY